MTSPDGRPSAADVEMQPEQAAQVPAETATALGTARSVAQAIGDAIGAVITGSSEGSSLQGPPLAGAAPSRLAPSPGSLSSRRSPVRWRPMAGTGAPGELEAPAGTGELLSPGPPARSWPGEDLTSADGFGMPRKAGGDLQAEEKAEMEELSKVRRHLRCVTKLIQSGGSSSSSSLLSEAHEAVSQEIEQLVVATGALDFAGVQESDAVRRRNPRARVVKGQMLVSLKNLEDPKRSRWKARLVAVGCIIRDGSGARVLERVVSTIPISLTGMRLGVLWETLSEDGVCLSLDVPGDTVRA